MDKILVISILLFSINWSWAKENNLEAVVDKLTTTCSYDYDTKSSKIVFRFMNPKYHFSIEKARAISLFNWMGVELSKSSSAILQNKENPPPPPYVALFDFEMELFDGSRLIYKTEKMSCGFGLDTSLDSLNEPRIKIKIEGKQLKNIMEILK